MSDAARLQHEIAQHVAERVRLQADLDTAERVTGRLLDGWRCDGPVTYGGVRQWWRVNAGRSEPMAPDEVDWVFRCRSRAYSS